MTFYSWLKKQKDRDDPIGDLASDVLRDSTLDTVKKSNSLASWRSHLNQKGAPSQAIEALEEAFTEWKLTQ